MRSDAPKAGCVFPACACVGWCHLHAERVVQWLRDPCPYCGQKMQTGSAHKALNPSRDHVFPLSRGGLDELSNIVTCCWQCNNDKGSQTLSEWRAVLWRRGDFVRHALVGQFIDQRAQAEIAA